MFEAKSRRIVASVLGLAGFTALLVGALLVAALAQGTADDDAGSVTAAIPDGPMTRSAEQDAAVAAALENDFEVLAQSTPTAATQSLAPSIAAAERLAADLTEPIYFNDFAAATDIDRIDHFVHYRDPFVVNHESGVSDHDTSGGVNCTAPEETRPQSIDRPQDHIYQCFPGGNAELGHLMAYAMDSSGYGFTGGLPDQVFEDVTQISLDINTTSAGGRNFVEIKVLPANETYVNALPCGPDLPCNEGWDYDDIGGVGAVTEAADGTGLQIVTPARKHGYIFDRFNTWSDANGTYYGSCDDNPSFCFDAVTHEGNTGIRDRFTHVFRDNGDGTLTFGVAEGPGGTDFHWVTAPGSFPDGPVRVVIAFHNYTGTKDGNGPGFDNNLSPSTGGFTWHWDNVAVWADSATPSRQFFGGNSPDRIVTPNGCVAFAMGQRDNPHHTDIEPEFRC